MLIGGVAGTPPVNQPTASVRAQTANLAELALSRQFSDSSVRRPPMPPAIEDYTPSIPDETVSSPGQGPILSISPPTDLDDLFPPQRRSMLTHLLQTSPPEGFQQPGLESFVHRTSDGAPAIGRLHADSPNFDTTSHSPMSERTPLLPNGGRQSYGDSFSSLDDGQGQDLLHEPDLELQGHAGVWSKRAWLNNSGQRIRSCIKGIDKRVIWEKGVVDIIHRIPAIILGLLLNILDALSYGMILFPLGQSIFEKLGPDGISMFYVSCIISQLVYSLGGSMFHGGIGSEMVRLPFYLRG